MSLFVTLLGGAGQGDVSYSVVQRMVSWGSIRSLWAGMGEVKWKVVSGPAAMTVPRRME